MVFNSVSFFVFLFFTFLIYLKTAKHSVKSGNIILLSASYIFYGWWDWRFLFLIIISSLTDFIVGYELFKTESTRKRKLLLAACLTINLGMLFIFKYFNFFVDSFLALFGNEENGNSIIRIILPVGISFYTFQTLSYTIDIYRRQLTPTKSVITFLTFVSFFPQLVAGPIERAGRLIPQFEKKFEFNYHQASSGMKMMLWGLFKKVVIADQAAVLVNAVYQTPESYDGFSLIIATLLFGFQIYCDFSGYSDIAIGTARLFGIELMTNFRTPYFASSIKDFWHRWHISLSTWFRDYVYIPLGGNRKNNFRKHLNILITFTLSGLWHGANITFVVWGFLHGFLYFIESLISPNKFINKKAITFAGIISTYLAVNFLWIFFRAENWTQAKNIIEIIFKRQKGGSESITSLLLDSGILTEPGRMLIFIFPFFILSEILLTKKELPLIQEKTPRLIQWSLYYMVLFVILFFGVLNSAPQFIYFQF
jgi:D-alanyl-lipoteichoic acid acyltransferase DltB (MBOAT superfamily)